jgi:hypothetical protein
MMGSDASALFIRVPNEMWTEELPVLARYNVIRLLSYWLT